MKRLIGAALFLSAALLACNLGPTPTSEVRFFNAVPDTIGVKVFFGQDLMTTAPNGVDFRAAFPGNTTYRTLNAGTLTYSLCPADLLDCPSEVKNRTVVLGGAKKTSVILVGTKASNDNTGVDARPLEIVSLSNDTVAPAAGKSRLRVVHAAAVVAAKAVDLFITAPDTDLTTITTPAQVNYKGTYDYRDLNAGTYRIRATEPGVVSPVLVDSDNLTLEAGKTYTAIITNPDAGNANKGVTLLTDK
ncbi:MAG: DUF4397 domain-containing protein [Deinococcales bacterium]